ncbi:hypothetical protein [Paractinoplanes deccanensis]|uniref:hypothetical protein n=1 Tax=Paractinoplanes deccanensis TaxID=113561 RepID=UPI001943F0C1|nr:hypothetical protein [Actinoplanes deccanensis]
MKRKVRLHVASPAPPPTAASRAGVSHATRSRIERGQQGTTSSASGSAAETARALLERSRRAADGREVRASCGRMGAG